MGHFCTHEEAVKLMLALDAAWMVLRGKSGINTKKHADARQVGGLIDVGAVQPGCNQGVFG
jgi:hypothetical protein